MGTPAPGRRHRGRKRDAGKGDVGAGNSGAAEFRNEGTAAKAGVFTLVPGVQQV